MTVDRLDFSKPPPGYKTTCEHGRFYCEATIKEPAWRADGEADAISAAWAHHKARRDPPGMSVAWESDDRTEQSGPGEWHIEVSTGGSAQLVRWLSFGRKESTREAEARAAAWAWYEDAIEVADLLDGENGPAESWPDDFAWPQPLTWTSERRAKVRTLCLNGGDWSEVLSG